MEDEQPNLASLIARHRGDRTAVRLAQDCGNAPTNKRINQITSGPISAFPDADTIKGLSRGLGVSVTAVVLASARSIGLEVEQSPDDLVLKDAGMLPPASQQVIKDMAKILTKESAAKQ